MDTLNLQLLKQSIVSNGQKKKKKIVDKKCPSLTMDHFNML